MTTPNKDRAEFEAWFNSDDWYDMNVYLDTWAA